MQAVGAPSTILISKKVLQSEVITANAGCTMIGVVLWSDNSAGKAVFWCEDQGDLAYYEEPGRLSETVGFFETGDMVQFEVSVQRRLRIAGNPQLIQEKAGYALTEALRQEMGNTAIVRHEAAQDAAPQSAQIIQFSPRATTRQFSSQREA